MSRRNLEKYRTPPPVAFPYSASDQQKLILYGVASNQPGYKPFSGKTIIEHLNSSDAYTTFPINYHTGSGPVQAELTVWDMAGIFGAIDILKSLDPKYIRSNLTPESVFNHFLHVKWDSKRLSALAYYLVQVHHPVKLHLRPTTIVFTNNGVSNIPLNLPHFQELVLEVHKQDSTFWGSNPGKNSIPPYQLRGRREFKQDICDNWIMFQTLQGKSTLLNALLALQRFDGLNYADLGKLAISAYDAGLNISLEKFEAKFVKAFEAIAELRHAQKHLPRRQKEKTVEADLQLI